MSQTMARPGPFRVLLWKEWRQQRWTLCGMTALALVLFVLGGTLLKRWSFGLSGAAYALALLGVPLVLSAQAFAGEDEDGTALFLRELPFRPLAVFAVKFLVAVLASWAVGGVAVLTGWLWPGYPDDAMRPVRVLVFLAWAFAPLTASFSALLAALPLRSLATALLAAVLLAVWGVLGWLSLAGLLAARVIPPWLVVILAGEVGSAVMTAGGLAARRHPRAPVQALRSLGGCAGVVVVCLLPGLLSYLYLNVLATPAAYLRANMLRRSLGWISVSVPYTAQPAGVVIECQPYDGHYGAAALLEPVAGRCTWVDRLARGFGARASRGVATWSPDGRRASWASCLPVAADGTSSPRGVEAGWGPLRATAPPWLNRPVPSQSVHCVLDLTTQRLARLPNLPWSLSKPHGGNPWYDAQWLATVTVERSPAAIRVSFVNVDEGRQETCMVPVEAAADDWERVSVAMAPGRAVCVAIRPPSAGGVAEGRLVMALATPEATVARLVEVRGLVPEKSRLRNVSPDARWALFEPFTWDDPGARLDLVDLHTGDTHAMGLPSEPADFGGYQRRFVQVCGFVAGGKGILVSSLGTLGLYDLERQVWVTYLPPRPPLAGYSGQPVSVSPDGRRALLVFLGGGARLVGDSTAEPRRGTVQWIFQMVRGAVPGEADAVVVELATGQMTTVHMDFGGEPADTPGATWFGNDHILVLSSSGICRYGLDGSREVLYP
jgi:hypothetical protein